MEIETLLNWAIPALIVIFFVGLFYVKLKNPIDSFFSWIGRGIAHMFDKGKEASESVTIENVISYE